MATDHHTKDGPPIQKVLRIEPLLGSIAREIAERDADLARIEGTLLELEQLKKESSPLALRLIANAAVHRCELRRIGAELRRLGCTLISRRPPTIFIPAKTSRRGGGWLWQPT